MSSQSWSRSWSIIILNLSPDCCLHSYVLHAMRDRDKKLLLVGSEYGRSRIVCQDGSQYGMLCRSYCGQVCWWNGSLLSNVGQVYPGPGGKRTGILGGIWVWIVGLP